MSELTITVNETEAIGYKTRLVSYTETQLRDLFGDADDSIVVKLLDHIVAMREAHLATVAALQRELATERAAREKAEVNARHAESELATVRTKHEFLLDAVRNAGYEFLIPEERA